MTNFYLMEILSLNLQSILESAQHQKEHFYYFETPNTLLIDD